MFKIKMADFVIQIDNKYDFIFNMCRDYITEQDGADFCVSCSDEDMEAEKLACDAEMPNGYIESVCIYRNLCTQLPLKDAFLIHCAVIEVDGKAYAFLAKSGTGKSTHISLWHKLLGNRVRVINGDKPIFRYIDGELYAYGTPWCGKEGWHTNTKAPLGGLCFIERAPINSIEPLPPQSSASRVMNQIIIPSDAMGAIKTLELMDRMLTDKKSWLLKCNISIEAAQIAYNALRE